MASRAGESTRRNTPDLDQVEVLRPLGRGAGSELFLVRDPRTGRRYALKVVERKSAEDQKYIEQALHEIEVARRIDHQNLIKSVAWDIKRRWFGFGIRRVRILMEYADGEVLERLNCPLEVAVAILLEIARALEHMHERGVFHADLKPANVIVTWDGRVKVFDYGLAWIKGQQKHRIQGTRGYLAPEQVAHRIVNEKTDIYNFGMLAYRLLTGTMRSTTTGTHALGLGGIVTNDIRESRSDIPPALGELVMRCVAERPQDRPPSMRAVREELEAIAADIGASQDKLADFMQSLRESRSGPWSVRS